MVRKQEVLWVGKGFRSTYISIDIKDRLGNAFLGIEQYRASDRKCASNSTAYAVRAQGPRGSIVRSRCRR